MGCGQREEIRWEREQGGELKREGREELFPKQWLQSGKAGIASPVV